jgi:Fe2+-dicitrate sensor, membrane component
MKEKPFYVRTDAFKMKVYGTKFDVRAYKQDCEYNIVLVEGKVSMQSNKDKKSKEVFLAPKQKASICKGGNDFEISNVENIDAYTSWMYGYLTFKDVDVREVLKQVARYYNVDIEPKLPDNMENISGKLDLKDDLDKVLNGIAFISKTHYKKSGENYMFYE